MEIRSRVMAEGKEARLSKPSIQTHHQLYNGAWLNLYKNSASVSTRCLDFIPRRIFLCVRIRMAHSIGAISVGLEADRWAFWGAKLESSLEKGHRHDDSSFRVLWRWYDHQGNYIMMALFVVRVVTS